MEIRDLTYLLTSAKEGNFARAARSLGINSSTISRRIGRFEDELGLAVFERRRTGVRLTAGGKAILCHVRRALAEVDAIRHVGGQRGSGAVGEIRLGVRMPPVGEPLRSLLIEWRERYPDVLLTIYEMNKWEIQSALRERRIDVALVTSHALWSNTATEPLYRERLVAAVPRTHPLAEQPSVNWDALRRETILVQEWEDSQAARELYASLLGDSARFRAHAASKQSVFALISAGFGITLAAAGQSEVAFPGVVFKSIDERDASIQIALVWLPELEDATVGRFVAFLRDEVRSRQLL